MTDADAASRERIAYIEAAFRGGLDWVQVRDRSAPAGTLFRFATALRTIALRAGGLLSINRRLDIASAVGAGAVHLGYDAFDPAEVLSLWRLLDPATRPLIGVSTHSVEEAELAQRRGADYAHLAPIFDPLSKTSTRPALGVTPLLEAKSRGLSIIAQGGIEPQNAEALIHAGALGIAVTGAILNSAQPEATTRALRETIDRAANSAGSLRQAR